MDDLTELILRDAEKRLKQAITNAELELGRFLSSGTLTNGLYREKMSKTHRTNRMKLLVKASNLHAPEGFTPVSMLHTYPVLVKAMRASVSMGSNTRAGVVARDKTCRWCKEKPAVTVDHVIPRARGGSNRVTNLVGSCAECNQVKSDFLPKELGWKLHVPLRAYGDTPEKH